MDPRAIGLAFGIIMFGLSLAVAGALLWLLVRLFFPNRPLRYCVTCGTHAKARPITRGSLAIEIVLWFFFIVPGLIYSLWRLSTRKPACPACGATALVPPDSPAALQAKQQNTR